MALTVREALELPPMKMAKVVAGRGSLDNAIKYVDNMEVPDLRPWLRPNVLLVTTAYVIRDDTEALEDLVRSLADVQAAGMVLKTARFLGTIPRSVIDIADKLSVPLIEMPKEVPFIDITHSVMKEILGRQARYLEYSEQVRTVLTRLELEETGTGAIAEALASLVGNEVAIAGPDFEPIAWASPGTLGAAAAQDHPPEWLVFSDECRDMLRSAVETVQASPGSVRVSPVLVKGEILGYVAVREEARSLTEMELIALEHTTTTVALEMIKARTLEDMRRRVEIDFFTDLLIGNVHARETAVQKARALGYPVGRPVSVIVLRADARREDGSAGHGPALTGEALARCAAGIRPPADAKPVLVARGDNLVCLLPVTAPGKVWEEGRAAVLGLQQAVKAEAPDLLVSGGVSNAVTDLMKLPDGYKEANQALQITVLVNGPGSVGLIGKLMPYRFFLHHPSRRQMEELFSCVLGPLVEHDRGHNTNLLDTLVVYLMNGEKQKAADKLFIHRNTLAYRLRQIEQILGADLTTPEDSFHLSLAVRVGLFLGCCRASV